MILSSISLSKTSFCTISLLGNGFFASANCLEIISTRFFNSCSVITSRFTTAITRSISLGLVLSFTSLFRLIDVADEVGVTADGVEVTTVAFDFALFLSFVCEKALVPRHANNQNVSKYFTNCCCFCR